MPDAVSAVLLNPSDPLFVWEHMNAHRKAFGVMAPLDRFSRLPYLLDPSYGDDIRAGPWNFDHQQAHDDLRHATIKVASNLAQNEILADSNLKDAESQTWWTHANHTEHYITNQAVAHLPATYPFW